MSTKRCPVCNLEVPANAAFCPNCGANLSTQAYSAPTQSPSQAQPQQPTIPTPPPQQQPQRPTGVVILAALEFISAVLVLVTGIFAGSVLGFIAAPLASLGVLFILIGLVELLLAWGLYMGRSWARLVAMLFAVIGLLDFPLGTILGLLILYYLTRPHVKAFFGVK
ncbi:MAG: zinc ribbon domain-containing protein [Thermoprotei archaeon]